MSWGEVMKLLNKRKDKALNEIMEEIAQRFSDMLRDVPTANEYIAYSSTTTATCTPLSITGAGRLQGLRFTIRTAQNTTSTVTITCDDIVITIKRKYTGTLSAGGQCYISVANVNRTLSGANGQVFMKGRTGYFELFTECNDAWPLETFPAENKTKTIDSSSTAYVNYLLPCDLHFKRKFEIKATTLGTGGNTIFNALYTLDE